MRQVPVLAAVTATQLARLRQADPARFEMVSVPTWEGVIETIRRQPVEMAVVDPVLGGVPRTEEIERVRQLFPSLPIVVYTRLAPEMAETLLALGRAGVRRAIFSRFDDSPGALRALLGEELAHTASEEVRRTLAARLLQLPGRLRWVVETALDWPVAGLTVEELARRTRIKRRTCERWFARSGLPSPRMLLMLVRLLYAHRLLRDPGYTVEDVTLKLGYGKARTLQMRLKEVFGLTAGELRFALTTEEAVAHVAQHYFPIRTRAAS